MFTIFPGTVTARGLRRLFAAALVVSFLTTPLARAQENLPGIVSGKKIAIVAAVAAGAVVTIWWLHKRSKRQPQPSIEPGRMEFGEVAVGRPVDQEVVIANVAHEPLTIRSVSLPSGSFHIDPTRDFPLVVPPAARVMIRITFVPPEPGMFADVVRIELATPRGLVRSSTIAMHGRGV
jgi:hypothetical protein